MLNSFFGKKILSFKKLDKILEISLQRNKSYAMEEKAGEENRLRERTKKIDAFNGIGKAEIEEAF